MPQRTFRKYTLTQIVIVLFTNLWGLTYAYSVLDQSLVTHLVHLGTYRGMQN